MYKIVIYFVNGNKLKIDFPNEKNVLDLIKLFQDKKILKDYNGIVTVTTNVNKFFGININNITNYTIEKVEKSQWEWKDLEGKIYKMWGENIMKIGDKVIIERKRRIGEKEYDESRIRRGKIVDILPTFYVVMLEKGYRECYAEKELQLDTK